MIWMFAWVDNITMFSDFLREDVDRAIEPSGLPRLIAEHGEDHLNDENGSGRMSEWVE